MTKKIKLKSLFPSDLAVTKKHIAFGVSSFREKVVEFNQKLEISSIEMEMVSVDEKTAIIKLRGKRRLINEFLVTLSTNPIYTQFYGWEAL